MFQRMFSPTYIIVVAVAAAAIGVGLTMMFAENEQGGGIPLVAGIAILLVTMYYAYTTQHDRR